jgi:RimJ/RimL family protein N-acetyltransferase
MYLRRRMHADLASIVSWVADSEALYLFAGPRLRWPLTEQQLDALDEVDGMAAWVLVDDTDPTSPIGHVDLTVSGTEVRIGRVIVDPDRRGEHLGFTLVRLALDTAEASGAIHASLNVIRGNLPAIRTYERLGFVTHAATERPDVVAMSSRLNAH